MSAEMAAEIAANWARSEDSIAAAKTLASSGFFDAAASRAYYAGFYAATAVLLREELTFGSHGGVINGIHQHFVKSGRLSPELGRSLNWLAELRAVGDYGETRHVPEQEAQQAIETAERLSEALEQLIFGA